MSPDQRPGQHPEWAERERADDLAWVGENFHIFMPAALAAYEELGRGALVVDTTVTVKGQGNPFAYFPQEGIEARRDEDIKRMVREYDPAKEFVVSLLKAERRTSTYRVRQAPRQQSRLGDVYPFSWS